MLVTYSAKALFKPYTNSYGKQTITIESSTTILPNHLNDQQLLKKLIDQVKDVIEENRYDLISKGVFEIIINITLIHKDNATQRRKTSNRKKIASGTQKPQQ